MKTTMYTLVLSIIMMACSNGNEQSTDTKSTVEEIKAPIPKSLLADYIKLKDAFVKSDFSAAKNASSSLGKSMKIGKMDATLIEAVGAISSTDDLKVQRTAFKTITDGLIVALKEDGTEQSVFVQYCPMAFNNTGANWLSLSEEIRNPYFGDMMLTCGRVEDKIVN